MKFKNQGLQSAWDSKDPIAFIVAAEGVTPDFVQPSCARTRMVVTADQYGRDRVIIGHTSVISSTPTGTHDSIRDGASTRVTIPARTMFWLLKDLV